MRRRRTRSSTGPGWRQGLRVDFTYDEIEAPIALEITSLPVPGVLALNAEVLKLESELNALAVDDTLGEWSLAVFGDASVQNLWKPLTELIRSQKTRSRAGTRNLCSARRSASATDRIGRRRAACPKAASFVETSPAHRATVTAPGSWRNQQRCPGYSMAARFSRSCNIRRGSRPHGAH